MHAVEKYQVVKQSRLVRQLSAECASCQQNTEPEIVLRKVYWRGAAVRLVTENGQRHNNDAALNEVFPEALC